MANAKLKLDKRSKKQDGTFPIKIYVSHKGDFFLSTDISIKEVDWVGSEESPTTVKRYNTILTSLLAQVKSTIGELRVVRKLPLMSKTDLKRVLIASQAGNQDFDQLLAEKKAPLLIDYYGEFIKRKDRPGTLSVYGQTIIKLGKYYDVETLKFEDITLAWLREFESEMRGDGLAINTMSIHLRNLRSLINSAIDEDIIDQNLYPFRKFKIKSEPTMKRSLTVEQLRTLRDYPCEEHQERYRDMFMLIFYLIGINAVDLFGAKGLAVGRLEFRRAKTGRLYSIKIEDEALAIIEKYQGKEYLLNICDNYGTYKDFLHRMNNNLKQIGEVEMVANGANDPKYVKRNKKSIKPLFPTLSSYWARHTWATIAADLDIPDETISLALGHAGANSTTNIYINRNQRKVDEANRKVIDHLNNLSAGAGEAVD